MRSSRLVLLLSVVVSLAACKQVIKAQQTPQFPTTWDEEPGWEANMGVGGSAVALAPLPPKAPIAPPAPVKPTSTGPVADRGLVAVLPADVKDAHLDKGTASAFDEWVRTIAGDALSPYGYTVLTGETTLAVLADNGIDVARACEASCALQTARELKAKLFLSGTVAKTEGQYVGFVRLFEVSSGRQLASVSLEGDTVRSLRESFSKRADAFFSKALGSAR